jgi:redox-sensitive bicupin YhaK (pirin superfamily)
MLGSYIENEEGENSMITIRKANERGHVNHGWLDTYHTFSFGDYRDLKHMGFRSLRVMNEDRVDPGQGFGMHPHSDMEIVTYVLEGELAHQDSMGNGSVIRAGDFQRMTAGTGIYHSEVNPSSEKPVHLYQIWLRPLERRVGTSAVTNQLELVASHDGRDGSLTIHQDADIYLSKLDENSHVEHQLGSDRHVWLQVLRGDITLNGNSLTAGDGAAVSDEVSVTIAASGAAEVMLFDMN